MPRLAHRTNDFLTFRVMELFKQAQARRPRGDIISLGIGEPDFTAPPQVVEGTRGAFRPERLQPDRRFAALREAIAGFYLDQFGARVDPSARDRDRRAPPAP